MDNKSELKEVKKLLDAAENKIRQAKQILFSSSITSKALDVVEEPEADSIQGVFDGEKMTIGKGKSYNVPPNYASKSKLVPGDLLKLNIMPDGKYIFKQIGPVSRINKIGILETVTEGEYQVDVDGRKFKVLAASVTYFNAKEGDKIAIVVPADDESVWAAVDNKL